MNILYTLDKGFETQFLVSLNSLIKETKCNVNVFIIFDNMNQDDIKIIEKFRSKRIKIVFLEAPILPKKLIPDRGHTSQYYRLYISNVLKKFPAIERILYLDCDTLIINSEIERMFDMEMGEYAIAATVDPWGSQYKEIFKLDKETNMFNSGIMLIDIKNWRKKNYDQNIKKLVDSKKSFIQADQGILNEVVKGRFKILNPKYNVISSYFEMNYKELMVYRKPVHFYSEEEIKNAVKDPVIVHFTSTFLSNRPWQEGSHHIYKKNWLYYTKIRNMNLKTQIIGCKKKFIKNMYYKLPRKLAIKLFGFLQSEVRPKLYKIKCIKDRWK